MGKIKGWKKFSENSNGVRWEETNKPEKKKKYVYVVPIDKKGNTTGTIRKNSLISEHKKFERIKLSGWESGVGGHSSIHKNKKFKTKADAKKWALSQMKKKR